YEVTRAEATETEVQAKRRAQRAAEARKVEDDRAQSMKLSAIAEPILLLVALFFAREDVKLLLATPPAGVVEVDVNLFSPDRVITGYPITSVEASWLRERGFKFEDHLLVRGNRASYDNGELRGVYI